MSEREEPAWLSALEITAKNPLMKDQQIIPIINDGTFEAVWNYIAALRLQLAAVREELAETTEAFTVHLNAHNAEVPALRLQLADVEAAMHTYRRANENAERALDEARRERDALRENFRWWKNAAKNHRSDLELERSSHRLTKRTLEHRAERAEAVVEAAKAYVIAAPHEVAHYSDNAMDAYDDLRIAVRALADAEGTNA